MSENNDSGNRWEKAAEGDDSAETADAPADLDPVEVPASPASTDAAPAGQARASRLPRWVTKSGLVTTGAAAAIFLGGGGVGYALGANHDDGSNAPKGRFDHTGFNGQGPGGRFPGDGQAPGGGQGQDFGGPNSQPAPQNQSQGNGSSSSSGSSS